MKFVARLGVEEMASLFKKEGFVTNVNMGYLVGICPTK
jgi:hypothetical protein